MFDYHYLPHCSREVTRKVQRYMKKHPTLTFTQAYNKLYHTDYNERGSIDLEATTVKGLKGSIDLETTTVSELNEE